MVKHQLEGRRVFSVIQANIKSKYLENEDLGIQDIGGKQDVLLPPCGQFKRTAYLFKPVVNTRILASNRTRQKRVQDRCGSETHIN